MFKSPQTDMKENKYLLYVSVILNVTNRNEINIYKSQHLTTVSLYFVFISRQIGVCSPTGLFSLSPKWNVVSDLSLPGGWIRDSTCRWNWDCLPAHHDLHSLSQHALQQQTASMSFHKHHMHCESESNLKTHLKETVVLY